MANTRATSREYLRYQYADSEKLRIRADAHRLYSERPNDWQEWVLARLGAESGQQVLDGGSGPGLYHRRLAALGVRVTALDFSLGMAQEARDQARRLDLPVEALQADLQALPFADAAFDRAMANHVLYHVPDQLAAMRELRRVTRPGGRVMMATVGADQCARMLGIHREIATELGLEPLDSSLSRFSLAHLEMVRRVFPDARVEVRHDAFVFPDAESVLRYYASGFVDAVAERDGGAHRPRLLELMRQRVDEIVRREGCFRDAKDAGAFVADL